MLTHPVRAAGGLALLAICCLCLLPACNKKKKSTDTNEPGPPAGYTGSKSGPPGGPQPASNQSGMSGRGPLLTNNAVSRQGSSRNLKMIGLAMHNYHDATASLPHAIADASGKPGLSWRVAILPYVEQDTLYRQFKLDEPWDSEHNKKLVERMPSIFAPGNVSTNGQTYYRSFTGQGTVMPTPAGKGQPGRAFRGISILNITDGTANTFMVAEAAEPVIWTKPDELAFTPGKPPRLGGGVFAEGFHAIMCDGSVRWVKSGIDSRTLSNLIQINDGQIVDIN